MPIVLLACVLHGWWFVLGERGKYTFRISCTPGQAATLRNQYPGIEYAPGGGGVMCSWDAIGPVASYLGKPTPEIPTLPLEALPGFAGYQELLSTRNFEPRPYQAEDAVFLANRAFAMLCNPMRTGKSLTALLGAKLAARKRILILCPSISKWVWGDEVAKWLGVESLVLSGLSHDRALRYCGVCRSRGRLEDGRRCPACRQRNGSSYGYHIHEILETTEPLKRDVKGGAVLLRCRKHQDVWSRTDAVERCWRCKDELAQVLASAPVVICNYDILQGKAFPTLSGRTELREGFNGWGEVLQRLEFDLAILDEAHVMRGFDTSYDKTDKMLSDRVRVICESIPQVWGVTGTPIFGLVRDLYGQLSAVSGGLFGDPKEFTTRYCAGHAGEYSWVAKGSSNEDELQARLRTFMISRPRSQILKDMPPKVRRVIYIDNPKPPRRNARGKVMGTLGSKLDQVAPVKHPVVLDAVITELAEGMKNYVLTYRPKHAEKFARLLAKEMNKRDWKRRMQHQRAEIFLGQKESQILPKKRRELAEDYRRHQGAACFIATIDSMPGSVSLKGVESTHMVDFHPDSPSAQEQAEERGYEPGIPGFVVTHYIVKNSADEDFAAILIPKWEAKDRVMDDENAKDTLAVLSPKQDASTLEEIMARHTAHLWDDDDDDD